MDTWYSDNWISDSMTVNSSFQNFPYFIPIPVLEISRQIPFRVTSPAGAFRLVFTLLPEESKDEPKNAIADFGKLFEIQFYMYIQFAVVVGLAFTQNSSMLKLVPYLC